MNALMATVKREAEIKARAVESILAPQRPFPSQEDEAKAKADAYYEISNIPIEQLAQTTSR